MEEVRLKIIEIVSQIPESQLDGLLGYLEAMVNRSKNQKTKNKLLDGEYGGHKVTGQA